MTHSSPSRIARVRSDARSVPASGLVEAIREVHFARQDPGEVALLLLLGAVRHDRGPDGVHRHERERRVRALYLVEEDELVERAAPLAAVLDRPADAEPAVDAHL